MSLTNRHPPMTNVLAILIATSGFSAAVETSNGFVERSFENTAAGAEQFWEFAEPLIRAEGKKVKVCTVTLAEDGGAIMNWLLDEDFGPASISRYAFREFVSKHGQPAESAAVAAKACLAILPFIRRAQ
ncbi:hypothetical protein QWZ02_19760 [Kinneretia asaccharophila]|uniref:hypothetical protein n=1 Tax=Roseateles asaccharophilus TaxID=582607 RepID=UPI00105C7D2B|nr:hypothetical protein [Roseateles asaccharophilus]MDN3546692.1 hypothetical protein [Roseateles asaccharophilus]